MNKRVSLMLTTLFVLLPLAGCANSTASENGQVKATEKTTTAVDTVSGFYERYFAAFAKDAATPDIAMSKAFKAEIQKSEQACKGFDDGPCGWGADANPYLNSQDHDDNLSYASSGISFKETAPNTVRVDLNVIPSAPDGGKTTIVFNMVQENGQWVADDVLYPDGKGLYSTRKALADERADLARFAKDANAKPSNEEADLVPRNAKGEVVENDAFRMGKGCPKVGAVKSPSPSKPTQKVTFVNKIEDRATLIYWLNPDGEPVETEMFGDNGKVDIHTYNGAAYIVKDFDGTCYGGTHTIKPGQTEVIVK